MICGCLPARFVDLCPNEEVETIMSRRNRTHSFLLIDNGFDELEVIYLLHAFRRAGLSIKSVSLGSKLVYSQQGVAIKADHCLADEPFRANDATMLILPARGYNGEALRRDARVKSLIEWVTTDNGRVVVTDEQSALAKDLGDWLPQITCQPQAGERLTDFVDGLADRIGMGIF